MTKIREKKAFKYLQDRFLIVAEWPTQSHSFINSWAEKICKACFISQSSRLKKMWHKEELGGPVVPITRINKYGVAVVPALILPVPTGGLGADLCQNLVLSLLGSLRVPSWVLSSSLCTQTLSALSFTHIAFPPSAVQMTIENEPLQDWTTFPSRERLSHPRPDITFDNSVLARPLETWVWHSTVNSPSLPTLLQQPAPVDTCCKTSGEYITFSLRRQRRFWSHA